MPCLGLGPGGHDGGVGVDDGRLGEERGRLGRPRPEARPVDRLLQGHDRGRVEAPAEVPRRGRVGQARRPYAVQEHLVTPPRLDVVERPAAAQGVVGHVQHVVGLVVGLVQGEQVERGVDLFGQARASSPAWRPCPCRRGRLPWSARPARRRRWPARAPGRRSSGRPPPSGAGGPSGPRRPACARSRCLAARPVRHGRPWLSYASLGDALLSYGFCVVVTKFSHTRVCPKVRGDHRQWSPLTCCASDGRGRPSGVAVQAEIQTTASCVGQEPRW